MKKYGLILVVATALTGCAGQGFDLNGLFGQKTPQGNGYVVSNPSQQYALPQPTAGKPVVISANIVSVRNVDAFDNKAKSVELAVVSDKQQRYVFQTPAKKYKKGQSIIITIEQNKPVSVDIL